MDLSQVNCYHPDPKVRERLLEILEHNRPAFSRGSYDFGEYKHIVRIGLRKNLKGVKAMSRKIPPERLAATRELVANLMKAGILRQGHSNWISPCVIVPKKQEEAAMQAGQPDAKAPMKVRLCLDLTTINNYVRPTQSYIVTFSDMVDFLSTVNSVTVLDISYAFYSLRVTAAGQKLQAVALDNSIYMFCALAMGLRNASHIFAQELSHVQRPLFYCTKPYADNILCGSPDDETHLRDLANVLKALRQHGLKIKVSSIHAFVNHATQKLQFLGHQFDLATKTVHPNQDKIQGLLNMKLPNTQRALRRALGSGQFLSMYYPKYQEITAPLTDMLKGPNKPSMLLKWNPKAKAAWVKFIATFASQRSLHMPRLGDPYVLVTDGGPAYIAGSLYQKGAKGEFQPIAHFSKKVVNENLSQVEREALALMSSVRYFEGYLLYAKTEVLTDCRALAYIAKGAQSGSTKLAKWQLALKSFDIVVRYDNAATPHIRFADMLSRPTDLPVQDHGRLKALRRLQWPIPTLEEVGGDNLPLGQVEKNLQPYLNKIDAKLTQSSDLEKEIEPFPLKQADQGKMFC